MHLTDEMNFPLNADEILVKSERKTKGGKNISKTSRIQGRIQMQLFTLDTEETVSTITYMLEIFGAR